MQKRITISYYLYIVFTATAFLCGLTLLTTPIIMPYQHLIRHAPWNDVTAHDLMATWAMANIAGCVLLLTATGLLFLLISSYRKGKMPGIIIADITGFLTIALGLWTAVLISRMAGAFAPLIIVLSMLILYAAALIASFDISRYWHIISGFFHRKDRHVPPVAHRGV